jgi:hypothetical protein
MLDSKTHPGQHQRLSTAAVRLTRRFDLPRHTRAAIRRFLGTPPATPQEFLQWLPSHGLTGSNPLWTMERRLTA